MINKIDKIIEISDYLSNLDISSTLNKMKNTLENGNYLLTVMGQFSSGKSTLINSLLEKDVLPVNKTETTAIVTYLKYGEEDCAELVYNDGKTVKCTIDETMRLEQNSDSLDEICRIESINIYISSPILKNGLIIADTPGVNTVLKEHTDKTVQLFETSTRILYVVSGSMTQFDTEFLKTLKNKGLKSIIVRTYMDTIYSDEDDPDEVVKSETSLFREFTDEPVFFTSSKKESKFNENIQNLKSYILKNISEQANVQLEEAVRERTEHIALSFIPQIKHREDAILAIMSNNEEQYNKQKEELEKQAEKLKRTLENGKEKLKRRYDDIRRDADSSLESKARNEIRIISEKINKIDFVSSISAHTEIEDMMRKSCQNIRSSYVLEFDQIIKENKESVLNEINSYDVPINLSVNLPDSIDEVSDTISEIEDKISAMLMLQNSLDEAIAESRERIATTEEEKLQIETESQITSEAVESLRRELSEYGDYVERYKIKKGDHTNENRMKNIGRLADFATILIPGEAWVQLGGKILKGTKVAAEGAKIAKQADTAADVIRGLHMLKKNNMDSQSGEMLPCYESEEISTTDRAELERRLESQKTSPNLLDLLSVEYYFSKIGKRFDTPDTVVVDDEYRRRYDAGRKEITDRINAESRKAADERIKLLSISDKKEQEEIFIKEQEKRKIKANQDISTLEKDLEKAKKAQINTVSAGYYIDSVTSGINEFCSTVSNSVLPSINEKFEAYLDMYGVEIESEITKQRDAIDSLKDEFDSADISKLESELSMCRDYLEFLK